MTTGLGHYDGSAGTLVDTNVWIDCMDAASPWCGWAIEQLQRSSVRSPLHLNLVIYTELLIPGPDVDELNAMFDIYGTHRSPLPWACAPLVATAYARYRNAGGTRTKPMADFYIGAHAAAANLSVLTRDPRPYRSYFPRLAVVSP